MLNIKIKRVFQDMWTEYVDFWYERKGSGISISKANKDSGYTNVKTDEELKKIITSITRHAPDMYTLFYRDDVFSDKEWKVIDNYDNLMAYMKRLLKQENVDANVNQLEEEWND